MYNSFLYSLATIDTNDTFSYRLDSEPQLDIVRSIEINPELKEEEKKILYICVCCYVFQKSWTVEIFRFVLPIVIKKKKGFVSIFKIKVNTTNH